MQVDTPSTGFLTPKGERGLARLDRVLGWALIAVSALALASWWRGPAGNPHGTILEGLVLLTLGPVGPLLLLAARGVERRWRARWALQALPVAYPPGVLAVVGWGLV